MTKADLVDAVARREGITRAQAWRTVDAAFDVVTEALSAGEEVRVRGFGNFSVRRSAARKARNPQTGETLAVPVTARVTFRPSVPLREAVRDGTGRPEAYVEADEAGSSTSSRRVA